MIWMIAIGAAWTSAGAPCANHDGTCGLEDTNLRACVEKQLAILSDRSDAECTAIIVTRPGACVPGTASATIADSATSIALQGSCSGTPQRWQLDLSRDRAAALTRGQLKLSLKLPGAGAKNLRVTWRGPAAAASAPAARSRTETATPAVDLPPAQHAVSSTSSLFARHAGRDLRYIFVDEHFAVRPESDRYVTESDRIVVRVIARRALACRMVVETSTANVYQPRNFRIGGEEGLAGGLGGFSLVGEGRDEAPAVKSCGYALEPDGSEGLYAIADPEGREVTYVDFTFGPYTSDELVFHLSRKNRFFNGIDQRASIKVANHLRYRGWFEVSLVGSIVAGNGGEISVEPVAGSEVRRVALDPAKASIDVAVGVKWLALCFGGAQPAFNPMDVREADLCLGLSSGFSLTAPTKRFFPLGIGATLGGFFSLNVVAVLERAEALGGGLTPGDLFAGTKDEVPREDVIRGGVGLGIGLDPAVFVTLAKAIVTGK